MNNLFHPIDLCWLYLCLEKLLVSQQCSLSKYNIHGRIYQNKTFILTYFKWVWMHYIGCFRTSSIQKLKLCICILYFFIRSLLAQSCKLQTKTANLIRSLKYIQERNKIVVLLMDVKQNTRFPIVDIIYYIYTIFTSGAGRLYGGRHVFFTVAQTGQSKHLLSFYDSWRPPQVLFHVWKGRVRWGSFSCNMQLHHLIYILNL